MKFRDGPVAITVLILFSFWLFVALPIYYSTSNNSAADQCSTEEYKNYGFWEKTRCDPIAYFTVWLVGFTGVLAAVSIFQGAILVRSDKTARITAEAAKINAEAAKKSAEVAERAFSHSRQATFAFRRKKLQNIAVGKIPELEITFANLGPGDAYSLNIIKNFEILPSSRLDEPLKIPYGEIGTAIVVARGDMTRILSGNRPLTAEDIEDIKTGKAAICVWGQVRFENADGLRGRDLFSYVATGNDFDVVQPKFGACKVEIDPPKIEGEQDVGQPQTGDH